MSLICPKINKEDDSKNAVQRDNGLLMECGQSWRVMCVISRDLGTGVGGDQTCIYIRIPSISF